MTHQRSDVKFTAAEINSATGIFSGYGAVFGNLDSHSDIIKRGAFTATLAQWKAKGRLPRMLLMHGSNGNPFSGSDIPVGVWRVMREDAKGLFVEGQILCLDTDMGRRILGLMKGGALDGLSIGYRVKRSTPGRGTTKRWIEEAELREVSIVDEPSNEKARVASIKEATAAERAEEAAGRLSDALWAAAVAEKATPKDPLSALADRIRTLAR